MKDYVKKNIEICETKKRGTPGALYKDRFALTVALLLRFARRKKSLLDVGARDGILLEHLAKHGFRDLTGLDIWDEGLKTMKDNGFRTIRADIQEYRTHKRFHTIVLSHVLEHCPDPVKVLKNVDTMLLKHGVVFIEVPKQEDLRIEGAGHYSNFTTLDDLLKITPWYTRFRGECLRRIYYVGQKWPKKQKKSPGKKL